MSQMPISYSQDEALSDAKLTHLASKFSFKDLKTLAISSMGFTQTDLINLEGDCGDDRMKHNREILIRWRRKNSTTPDIILVRVHFEAMLNLLTFAEYTFLTKFK